MTGSGDTSRKLAELSFLHEVAQLASSARDWDEMLRIVIDRTTDAMGVEVSSLYLLERREGILRLVATNGLNRRFIGKARSTPMIDTTHIHAIMCGHGMILPVTSMYAARLEIIGETM